MTKPFEAYLREMPSGCIEWIGYRMPTGYGRYRHNCAHREAYRRAKGPIPPGMFVCHSCDNPPCCNPDHLWVGTHAENMADRNKKGRGAKWAGRRSGDRNPSAKLTQRDVDEIRQLRGSVKQTDLAARYGVSASTIAMILTGRNWKGASHG